MHILQVNKFYHIVGGTDRNFLTVSELLQEKGHEVAFFSKLDRKNFATSWRKYFVSNISFNDFAIGNYVRMFLRMMYSFEARKNISLLLNNFIADIAHIHQIYHHISPSILLEIKSRNIPIVHTVSDYHLISPHHNNLYHDGKICEVSKINKFYNTAIHRCVKHSYLASIAEMTEQYIHHIFGFYKKTIDYYISPSKFLTKKLVEYKISRDKIIYLPYFINCNFYKTSFNNENYILYFGRLYPEKGLRFLVEVMKSLPSIKLMIIGNGSEGERIIQKVKKDGVNNIETISKFIPESVLKKFIMNSRFTIFPSQSLEIFGISLLESYASGKPIIASNIGGIPEIVKDGYNGFLFEPGNINDCIEKINKLWNNPALCRKLGKNAREYVEKNFGPEEHYEKLMATYKKAVSLHK